jgi:hypothetical protein
MRKVDHKTAYQGLHLRTTKVETNILDNLLKGTFTQRLPCLNISSEVFHSAFTYADRDAHVIQSNSTTRRILFQRSANRVSIQEVYVGCRYKVFM